MRIITILSPTGERGTKGEYTKYRERLRADGYVPLGNDIFMCVTTSRKAAQRRMRQTDMFVPKTGRVIRFLMTERQWSKREYLVGEVSYQEKMVGALDHVVL